MNGRVQILDAAPYIKADTGRTLIPVRFASEALGAGCEPGIPLTRQVTITDRWDRKLSLP
ncbi:MAG: stalk domain-containing protein [Syntrophomonadaceae bacterium]